MLCHGFIVVELMDVVTASNEYIGKDLKILRNALSNCALGRCVPRHTDGKTDFDTALMVAVLQCGSV
jgi:hypothetical protein